MQWEILIYSISILKGNNTDNRTHTILKRNNHQIHKLKKNSKKKYKSIASFAINKLQENNDKEEILKAVRKKSRVSKGMTVRLTTKVSTAMMEPEKEKIYSMSQEKSSVESQILNPVKLSWNN